MGAVKPAALLISLSFLAACGQGGDAPDQPERISLDDARPKVAEPALSPDTEGARWTVTDSGQAIDFGLTGADPWLTLACDVGEEPPTLTVIRHVAARPGQKALFPVLGNGMVSRFKVDAALQGGEWRWEGELPAQDAMFDVFTGRRELEATLPGGGTLLIEGSLIPGEFVNWCRTGGEAPPPEQPEPDDDEARSDPPAR